MEAVNFLKTPIQNGQEAEQLENLRKKHEFEIKHHEKEIQRHMVFDYFFNLITIRVICGSIYNVY